MASMFLSPCSIFCKSRPLGNFPFPNIFLLLPGKTLFCLIKFYQAAIFFLELLKIPIDSI